MSPHPEHDVSNPEYAAPRRHQIRALGQEAGKNKLWYCCQCPHSVGASTTGPSNETCPKGCGHRRCGCCRTETVDITNPSPGSAYREAQYFSGSSTDGHVHHGSRKGKEGLGARYMEAKYWVCCYCGEYYKLDGYILQCTNCEHIFDYSHCRVEEVEVRVDKAPSGPSRSCSARTSTIITSGSAGSSAASTSTASTSSTGSTSTRTSRKFRTLGSDY
ncbi:hypothetical protein VTJ04DRAFT_2302 [Mycothermus thermophilus]|uniref:uncharacterized protein n=1 Tax=Humicola insolens TaxID=85995 RepID=UPI00374494FF